MPTATGLRGLEVPDFGFYGQIPAKSTSGATHTIPGRPNNRSKIPTPDSDQGYTVNGIEGLFSVHTHPAAGQRTGNKTYTYGFSEDYDIKYADQRSLPAVAIERRGDMILYDPSSRGDTYVSGRDRTGPITLPGSIFMGKNEASNYLQMGKKLAKFM